ncbi:hypothetical protein HZH68_014320 [Vespula germanica]|uniref:Uncharacterized protein n=1 Tax=Vespula germanica TaxID=30212 RepID=A0A834MVP4_VESGE|nr:hypothetical protein HZH68_014320 [Vespula germanica]
MEERKNVIQLYEIIEGRGLNLNTYSTLAAPPSSMAPPPPTDFNPLGEFNSCWSHRWFARGNANADAADDDGDDFDFDFDLDDFDDVANVIVIVIVIVKANESENAGGGSGDVLPYSRYTGPSINHCAHQPH